MEESALSKLISFSAPKYLSVDEMRAVDENCEWLGISRLVLMENAGAAVARAISEEVGDVEGKKVAVVAYLGNKGGDGFVAARHLAQEGAAVEVFLLGSPSEIRTDEARRNWQALQNLEYSVKVAVLRDSSQTSELSNSLRGADVVVDALLGTGAAGPPREPIASAVKAINSVRDKALVVSIDLPTGLDADSGKVYEPAVRAHITVTHHKPKRGFLSPEAKRVLGKLVVANIGVPPEAEVFAGPGDVRMVVKPRKREAKKGDFGRVAVVGGSRHYSGAPALSALAALRAGVDIAIVYAPEPISSVIRSYSPNLIVEPLPGDSLTSEALSTILDALERFDAFVVGPGLGTEPHVAEACIELISKLLEAEKAVVVDADGLKALAKRLEVLRSGRILLTPHAGEFRILTSEEPPPEEGRGWVDRMAFVKKWAKKLGATILLKGSRCVVSDGERVKVNRTGNPGMTVGGTGDVLAGLAAAFLAWGNSPFRAGAAASYVNGVAGDLAYQEKGFHMVATDLIEKLPEALKPFDRLA